MTESRPNRLAKETSTYLKGASHQPVDWYPWGEEAFRRAKELDRPILLDIGATWCHWCHVIDRESYEDPELAKVINEHFVAVKVDRDERPDIDARYQQAVGAIAGQGGWPLTGFLTSDGKAFYGGTYFPPKDTHGRPGFRRVLLAMAEYYRTNRADTLREADALHQALAEGRKPLVEEGVANEAMMKESADSLRGQFDPVNGGISGQQKFPHPGTMEWVMARYRRTRGEGLRTIVTRTLTSMARGGVYRQIGGEMHHNPRKNVLFSDQEPEAIAKALGIPVDRVRDLLTSGRKKLKSVRDRRPMPAVDRTIFASWNGMMISAVLEAAMAFGRDDLRAFALKSLDRIRKEMWSKEHGMWHASADGKRKVLGLLEDHVYVVDALLVAFSATGDSGYLRTAEEVMTFALKHFWDRAGGFVDLASDLHEGDGLTLREIRRRPFEDSPYAGANPVAALALQRLHALTGNDEYRLRHDELLISFAGEAGRYGPVFAGTYHLAAELWIHPPPEIVILGPRTAPEVRSLQLAAAESFAPGKTLLIVDKEDSYMPALIEPMRKTKEAKAGPVAFVCQGNVCSQPTSAPERLR